MGIRKIFFEKLPQRHIKQQAKRDKFMRSPLAVKETESTEGDGKTLSRILPS